MHVRCGDCCHDYAYSQHHDDMKKGELKMGGSGARLKAVCVCVVCVCVCVCEVGGRSNGRWTPLEGSHMGGICKQLNVTGKTQHKGIS